MLLTSGHSSCCGTRQARRASGCECAHVCHRQRPVAHTSRPSARRRVHQHCRQTVCAAGAAIQDPYKALGIPKNADTQAIKRAFKKKAKELHPDVNHAADASTRFMEVKMAYQLLTDSQKRQQYDRQQQDGFDWGDFVDGIANPGRKQPRKTSEEPFYSFTDFLKDLDADLTKWSDQVNRKGFKSLFEELYDAGLIAVGQLEKQFGLTNDAARTSDTARPSTSGRDASTASSSRPSASQGSATRPTPKPERDSEAEEAEAIRQRVKAFEAEAEQKKKQAEQEVDDMLADLKNRLKDR